VGSPESPAPRLWKGHAGTHLAGLLACLPPAFQAGGDPAWPSSPARLLSRARTPAPCAPWSPRGADQPGAEASLRGPLLPSRPHGPQAPRRAGSYSPWTEPRVPEWP